MTSVFRAPKGFEPPKIDFGRTRFDQIQAQEQAYIGRLAAWCREQTPGNELVGEVLSFPIGDGHASYMILRTRPLHLIHLDLGDGYMLPEFQIRGLRLDDVRRMLSNNRAFARLMASRDAAKPGL